MLTLLLAACAPGTLSWSTGEEPLRTALYAQHVTEGESNLVLFLSNGELDCELPDPFGATEEDAIALLDLQAAACREGARHVVAQLWQRPGSPLTGRWTGGIDAEEDWFAGEVDRVARATWVVVEEAEVDDQDGVVREIEVTELSWQTDAAEGGWFELAPTRRGLSGRFHLPEVHASGRFQARACPSDATLFAALASNPVAWCP